MKEPNTDAAIAADFGRYDKACTQAENEFEAERAAGRAPCACGCGLYEDEDDMVGFGLARDELELYIVAHLMEAERKREQAAAPATEAAAHIERLLTRVNAALAAAYREGGAAMNLPFLLARLDDISKAREEDLYLAVFPDQSGSVCALIDDSLVFEFATLSELQEWLDQQPGGQMAAPAAEREENS